MRRIAICFGALASSTLVFCGGDEFSSSGSGGAGSQTSSSTGAGAGTSTTTASTGGGTCPSGTMCAPPVPTGWSGPAVVYVDSGSPPACGSAWPDQVELGNAGSVTGSLSCGACSCGSVSGPCGAPTVVVSPTCGSGSALSLNAAGICTATALESTITVKSLGTAMASCPPQGGDAMMGEIGWEKQALVCAGATASASCGEGSCVPAPTEPFASKACIYNTGDLSCPSEYPETQTIYLGTSDTRACTACACAAPTGATCAPAVYTFTDTACSTGISLTADDGACYTPTGGIKSVKWSSAGASGGSCEAAGGEPMGTVVPAQPVTICCTQQ